MHYFRHVFTVCLIFSCVCGSTQEDLEQAYNGVVNIIKNSSKEDISAKLEIVKEQHPESLLKLLFIAAEHGNVAVFLKVFQKAASCGYLYDTLIQMRDDNNNLIHAAAIGGNVEIVETIIDWGGEESVKNKNGKTALDLAIENKKTDVVNFLKKRLDEKEKTQKEKIENEKKEKLKTIWGILNLSDDKTAIEFFKKNPINFDEKYLLGGTFFGKSGYEKSYTKLLPYAAQKEKWEFVKYLLAQKNVNIDDADYKGATALYYVANAKPGQFDIIQSLVSKKANIQIAIEIDRDKHEWDTPLHRAANAGNLQTVKLFIENGMNIDGFIKTITMQKEDRPVVLAAQNGHEDVVTYLVNKGADVNSFSSLSKMSLLHYAVRDNKEQFAAFLIKHGANVNTKLIGGKTSLHLAAEKGHKNMVKLLIENNADISLKDENAKTPYDIATDEKIKKLLKEAEAKDKDSLSQALALLEAKLLSLAQGLKK